jgi:hypothetical protein
MGVTFILSAGADVCGASQLCVGGIGFSPSGETGEGFCVGTSPRQRRLIGVTVCPSPNGEGMGLSSFLPDGVLSFQSRACVQVGLSFSPLGETGEG